MPRSLLAELKLDALLVTNLHNVRYLTGFTGSNGAVLLSQGGAILFTDPRYTVQSQQQVNCRVRIAKGPLHGSRRCRRWTEPASNAQGSKPITSRSRNSSP